MKLVFVRPLAAFAVVLGLAACSSSSEELACCKGPIFALNANHWSPTPADLTRTKDMKSE
ncbi:putative lipoprotein [Endobacter medicaginis]|uniref:Putative lipoprotein n=1 Tax=Endobacter medicaginis TaxID=1181271 RepID=A0A839V2Z4_9PROT|nr:type IV secretion system lipoprotein VirB7 [Endobacter medicaginis]MBB3175235.1 putative lipoprotein [Endobacter medicaginis]MCX5476281.1 type IV secretion system lipoprotein VirB7 [Endobacter medicaginis]NVN28961.1 hypothetical protein [Endobacter medicaginis]